MSPKPAVAPAAPQESDAALAAAVAAMDDALLHALDRGSQQYVRTVRGAIAALAYRTQGACPPNADAGRFPARADALCAWLAGPKGGLPAPVAVVFSEAHAALLRSDLAGTRRVLARLMAPAKAERRERLALMSGAPLPALTATVVASRSV